MRTDEPQRPRSRFPRYAGGCWALVVVLTIGACAQTGQPAGPKKQTVGPTLIKTGPSREGVSPTPTRTWKVRLTSRARWAKHGETIELTLMGSSTCPPVPERVEATPATGRIIVTVDTRDHGGVCTADLRPHTSLVKLDERMDLRRPVELILRRPGRPDQHLRL